MFRVLVRELMRLLAALVALVGAGVVLAESSGDGGTFGTLWSRLPRLMVGAARGDATAVAALIRLGAYAVVAALALSFVARFVGDARFVRRRGYSLPGHLAQLLRLRVVRLGAAVWGVALTVAQGGAATVSRGIWRSCSACGWCAWGRRCGAWRWPSPRAGRPAPAAARPGAALLRLGARASP